MTQWVTRSPIELLWTAKNLVRSCLLITLIKCLKGHRSLGSLFFCQVVKSLVSQSVSQWVSEWQGHLLSCSGQLKTFSMSMFSLHFWANLFFPLHFWTNPPLNKMVSPVHLSSPISRPGPWNMSNYVQFYITWHFITVFPTRRPRNCLFIWISMTAYFVCYVLFSKFQ